MAKFNVVQKQRRAQIAERKRAIHGDPFTNKLKNRTQPHSISAKRKRKLHKKFLRERKAIENALGTIPDVDMVSAQGSSMESKKTPAKFHVKKSVKIKPKQRKHKGENKGKSSEAAVEAPSVDVMVE